jgi:uncharacterized protein YecT (DUF1311 family)
MRIRIAVAAMVFGLSLPVKAQTIAADTQTLLVCLAQKGVEKAALDQPDGCRGMVRGPCLPEAPNTSESLDCITRESAAWTNIMETAFDEAEAKLPKAKFASLQTSQRDWENGLTTQCSVEDEGSLALVEKQFCLADLLAARAAQVYAISQDIKQ